MNKEQLIKYAKTVLSIGVNLQKNQYLIISTPISARPYVHVIADEAYKMGAKRVYIEWRDYEFNKMRVDYESIETLTDLFPFEVDSRNFFNDKFVARLAIVSEDPDVYAGVDANKKAQFDNALSKALKPFMAKQMSNEIRWCVCALPEEKWAKKLFPALSTNEAMEKLWDMICYAMRLDTKDPINEWKKFSDDSKKRTEILNNANIDYVHYTNSLGTDLYVGMMDDSIWLCADEYDVNGIPFFANIPTEEIFSAPHKDRINGKLYSALPLVYSGNIIDKFNLTFKDGKIVEYHAEVGEEFLRNIIETDEGSHYLGEIALVQYDSPISNLKTLFYETLFDENASCHFAIGEGYPSCTKSGKVLDEKALVEHGLNASLQHVDFMVGTSDLNVEATTKDGKKFFIIKDGNFVI